MAAAKKMRLGELLVRAGVIDEMQLQSALAHQKQWGGRLGRHIVELRFTDARTVGRALAKQLGLPAMDPTQQQVDLSLLKNFPEKYATENCCLPLQRKEKLICVVIADPTNLAVCDEIESRLGKRIEFMVAAEQTISELIDRAYRALEYGAETLEAQVDDSIAKAQSQQQAAETGTRYSQSLPEEEAGSAEALPLDEEAAAFAHARSALEGLDAPAPKPAPPPVAGAPSTPPPAAPSQSPKPVPTPAEAPLREVLLVDSDPSERGALRRGLRALGYDVAESPDLSEALARIQKKPPHAVVLEVSPENLKALDLCKKLRASERYRSLPLVLLSGEFGGWRVRADLAELAGGALVLEKPVGVHALLGALERAAAEDGIPATHAAEHAAHVQAATLQSQGRDHYESGEIDQAIACFERAAEFDEFLAEAYYHLGMACEQKNQLARAAAAYERAAQRDPESFLTFKNLALVYEKLGFHRKAYEAFERSARTCPNPQVKAKIKAHLQKLL